MKCQNRENETDRPKKWPKNEINGDPCSQLLSTQVPIILGFQKRDSGGLL